MRKAKTALMALVLLAACSGPPEQELESAQKQIERARKAQAEVYAPEMLREAEDLLSDASMKISEKSYAEARSLAKDAQKKGEEAEKAAVDRVSSERENGAKFAAATREQLEELKSRIAGLTPERRSSQQSLSLSVQEMEGLLQLFKAKLESGKFNEARNIQASLQQKLDAVRATLEAPTALPEKGGAAPSGAKISPQMPAPSRPPVKSPAPLSKPESRF